MVKVYHFGLFTVDAQSKPVLKLRIKPFVDAAPLVSGHHDEIVGVMDQPGVRPVSRPVFPMKHHIEPM